MRATANVVIEIGKLKIQKVKMGSAIESGEKISFNQLHRHKIEIDKEGEVVQTSKPCNCKLQQKMMCPQCYDFIIKDKKTEIIKGYPITKDSWITLSESEIEACKKESNEVMKVIQFVSDGDIPAIYHESAYFLWPEKDGAENFALLYKLLATMNKTALCKIVLRAKDHFMAIKPYEKGVLIAYDLHFPSEIRGVEEITPAQGNGINEEIFELAKKLVEKMSKPFDPTEIHDEYTEALRNIITAKAEGRIIEIEEVREEKKALSLKDALAESLKEAVNF